MPSIYEPSPMTWGDVQTAFRVNTDNAVVALVADCAAGLRTQWLEIAMEMGVFDFTDEVAARGAVDRSTACIEGLVNILGHTESITLTEDPEYGKLAIPVSSHTLSRDAKTLGPFIEALATRLIKDRDGIVSTYMLDFASGNPDDESEVDAKVALKQANRSLAVLLALAAAMNLPETVRSIRLAHPSADQEGFPADWLGPAFKSELIHTSKKLDVAPAFFAVYYSNSEALKAFAPAAQAQEKTGKKSKTKSSLPMFIDRLFDNKVEQVNALAMLRDWRPSCSPSTLALSWRDRLDPKNPAPTSDMAELSNLSCTTLRRMGPLNPFSVTIPAFEAIGAFDHAPGATIVEAVKNGRPAFVERFDGKVPWDNRKFALDMKDLLLETVNAISISTRTPHGEAEAAMVALMRLAVKDGRQDVFFQTNEIRNDAFNGFLGKCIVQPVSLLIQKQFNKVLVGFLENGMNPTAPMAPDALSPLEYAQAVNSQDAANLIRSFVARNSAHSILAEMDLSPFMDKPKR